MTVTELQKNLRPFKKVTVKQVRIYIKECRIQHLGVRQRPQQYPDDSAEIILRHLGLNGGNGQRKAA
jgi:hypothetical protein